MSGSAWMFVWLMLILKIPIAALLYLVWWASKTPETQGESPEPARLRPGPIHPRSPRWPSPPRRGPHAEKPPRAPQRVRAQARKLTRSH
jgi:hypothetical protein